jgi:hypothetical protein
MSLELKDDKKTARERAHEEIENFITDICTIPNGSFQMHERGRALIDHIVDAAKEEITGVRVLPLPPFKERLKNIYKAREKQKQK